MVIVKGYEKTDLYVELTTEDGVAIIPTDKFIAVDDESGYVSVKLIGSRKTVYLIPVDVYYGE